MSTTDILTLNIKTNKNNMTLGQQILIARKNKKLSQKELGKLIGMTDMQISNIERGKNTPHINNLRKISDALGVKFDI